ncbi:hypothetical protein DYB32_007824 [Aphanomyces invadans]|uniref:WW domain-containing protein n=1 Tax=Aphanomyces invadans TaxID=157072 RepID=A0A418AN06_9STRA|nr:hypothetical protein DYB32_007824 [Aphanomyces invadans]
MIHVIRRTKKATQIQAAFRKHVARKRFQACKHEWARDKAALTIQCAFRGRRARDSVAFKRWLRHQGACMECDEAVAQVFAVAYSLQLCTECALTLGQTMDGYGGLETLPIDVYRTRHRQATAIAAAYRGYAVRQKRRRVAAAITIQCAFRVYAAVKTLHALQDEYERKVQAAISHMKQRRKIRAVIQIQSQYRRRRDLRVAVAKRLARAAAQRLQALEIAIFAQTIVATRLARWYRRRYVRLNACAQTIQNGMRLHWGRQARHKWRANQREKANERAIVRLQCFGRSIMAKRELKALKLGMWVECMDEASGYSYYYHTATQATTWERPPELPETTQQRDLEPTTSFGNNDHSYLDETKQVWAQVWDETFQAFYYVNQETGDTTWTAPAEWSSPTNQDQS